MLLLFQHKIHQLIVFFFSFLFMHSLQKPTSVRQQASSVKVLRNRLQGQEMDQQRQPNKIISIRSQNHLRAYSNDQQNVSQVANLKSGINNSVGNIAIKSDTNTIEKYPVHDNQNVYFRATTQVRAQSRNMNLSNLSNQKSQQYVDMPLHSDQRSILPKKTFNINDIKLPKLGPIKARHDIENVGMKSMVVAPNKPQKSMVQRRIQLMNNSSNTEYYIDSIQVVPTSRSRVKRPTIFVAEILHHHKLKIQSVYPYNNNCTLSQVEIQSIACKTQAGKTQDKNTKTNQDIYISIVNFGPKKGVSLFSVCDGHGVEGHKASAFLKDMLPKIIMQNVSFCTTIQNYKDCLTNAFKLTDRLLEESSVDCTFSGSTCILTLMVERTLYSANVGDSRIIVGKKIFSEIQAIPLSLDHKPDDPAEQKRIESYGGRVQSYLDYDGNPIGPARVWMADADLPGLAMSRSFGDRVAGKCGVISEPEITVYELSDQDKFIVLASDGIWEFLSNQQVADIVTPFYKSNQPDQAGQKLVKEATQQWRANDEVIDDITCVVIFLKR